MRPLLAVLSLALAAALPARTPAAERRALTVAAAAGVRPALDALGRAFEAERPDAEVRVTTGASGALVAQLQNGAPFDLFLSADREYPRKVVAAGLAGAEGEVVYAIGTLVVWTPPGSRLDLAGRGLAALAAPGVRRIAIANPAVAPYGRAAEAALRSAGILEAVRDRLVLGTSVSQAAQFAERGAVDAALLPLSVARLPALAGGGVFTIPEDTYPTQAQSLVVLARAPEPGLARAFVAFVTGPAGRAILLRSGYRLP
jgi:molybdate transport system substrate-binding protein